MTVFNLPIVGAFYRPPAKMILDNLAVGTPLLLAAEPDNPHDPNAVAVWITTADIPQPTLDVLELNLPNVGLDIESFVSVDQWHLGYIPKEWAAQLRLSGDVGPDTIVHGTFMVGDANKPNFRFDNPVL